MSQSAMHWILHKHLAVKKIYSDRFCTIWQKLKKSLPQISIINAKKIQMQYQTGTEKFMYNIVKGDKTWIGSY